jgi:hypothetical protein
MGVVEIVPGLTELFLEVTVEVRIGVLIVHAINIAYPDIWKMKKEGDAGEVLCRGLGSRAPKFF